MKQALTLFIVLLLSSCLNHEERSEEAEVLEIYRQEYYIGDKLDLKGEDVDFQSTKGFTTPTIEIREGNYIIRVSKDDIIKQLELLASESDSIEYEDVIKAINISRSYLASSGDVAFDQMWSTAEKDGIEWSEVEKHDEHLVAKNVLREQICELLESGKFQLIESGKEQKLYYFARVDSNYGGNVKGVFSKSNQMIWICPPFVME
jgi:hypothetical protein